MLYLPVKGEVANFLSLQCLCERGMVLTLIVVMATFVLVRSEECFYEYNYSTGYMDYWCDDSYATFDEYVPDVTAPPSPPPTPPPPPPAFPTNHCRGGLPILSNQGRGGDFGGHIGTTNALCHRALQQQAMQWETGWDSMYKGLQGTHLSDGTNPKNTSSRCFHSISFIKMLKLIWTFFFSP